MKEERERMSERRGRMGRRDEREGRGKMWKRGNTRGENQKKQN